MIKPCELRETAIGPDRGSAITQPRIRAANTFSGSDVSSRSRLILASCRKKAHPLSLYPGLPTCHIDSGARDSRRQVMW